MTTISFENVLQSHIIIYIVIYVDTLISITYLYNFNEVATAVMIFNHTALVPCVGFPDTSSKNLLVPYFKFYREILLLYYFKHKISNQINYHYSHEFIL